VPILLRQGLMQTWLGLAAISLALTAVAWNGWPGRGESAVPHTTYHRGHDRSYPAASMRALYTEYALNAVGLVPHMIFLVDFVARGLGKGLDAGAQYWVLFGLGAIVGPLLSGHLADRTGFGPALRVAYLLQIVAVALPVVVGGPAALIVSSVVVGAFVPGIVALVLGRVNELLAHHPAAQKGAWSAATTSFAVLQAVAAYGLSFLFAHDGGNYATLFVIGAASLALALAVDLFAALRFGPKQA
jgi:predicted MFS family arabinose efflux permease